ncbi:MmgE/PrpD family protein [Chachezhania antarctica]|uniref:MmgE/PrpD family protein n=1 Tax=Chachezhania antarctica TaxID=2340860 RepID=UPI000EB595B9|nr:MmgE/PrpD family protein [Chachezhania antarctica]|tara:strand:+ start:13527 stop:14912 length:1386 start_codon:yes stop_codon:yes gene_type:complete
MTDRAPVTRSLAAFISGFTPSALPDEVMAYTRTLAKDGIGVLCAATHESVTAAQGIGDFAEEIAGNGPCTLIGRGQTVDPVNAALANGTLGYAADFEPHHPEAILHPIAVMIPTALALSEAENRTGAEALAAVALGCEVTYRVSMAMNPRALYDRGFHPSAIAGSFGAAAAAAFLLGLDEEQTVRALGLAGLQTSGLLAWQDDPREDARPFQMGLAARNGVMSAMLAKRGFGAPDRIFDGGHVVLDAYTAVADPAPLTAGLGVEWDGVMELAIKPYASVSFLHPALDALVGLLEDNALTSDQIDKISLRFAESGAHCVDDNPLKGHSAQYILPVRAAMGRLSFLDLFIDRRETEPEVARLAASAEVVRDTGAFNDAFPDFYMGEVTLTLTDGRTLSATSKVARGYPEQPLTAEEMDRKFEDVTATVCSPSRRAALAAASEDLFNAPDVRTLTALLAQAPDA